MSKSIQPLDVAGNLLGKGDTVATLSGSTTARVCDVSIEYETAFVRLRPMHMPYAKGIWHAADRVLRLAVARKPGDSSKYQSNNRSKSIGRPQAVKASARAAAEN